MSRIIPQWKRLLGCCDCIVHWKRGRHDLSTVRGLLANRFWLRVDWLIDLPRSLRWCAANRLCALAQRLRGDQTYDIGYGMEANLAGMLENSVWMKLVAWDMERRPIGEDDPADEWKQARREEEREEFNELLENLSALAGLAKASSWVEYWKDVRGRDHRRKTKAPAKPEFDY